MNPDRHDEQLARLSDYLDGLLSSDERATLEALLTTDPEIRSELDALRRVDTWVKSSAGPAPELDWQAFTEEARQRRETATARVGSARRRRLAMPLAAAAALAFVATTAVMWNSWSAQRGVDGASVAIVTIERTTVAAAADAVAVASLVRDVQGGPRAQMGPPAPRTLIVAVAGRLENRTDNGSSDEEAGYL